MHNIMIVSEAKSHLVGAIIRELERASYHVIMLRADTDAINGCKDSVSGVLVIADENMIEQDRALYFLKDRAIMDGVPVFVVGDSKVLKVLYNIIPPHIVRLEFTRPINKPVSEMVEKIDSMIKQFGRQKKILVVDDSGQSLRNVKGWFEDRYTVFLANSATMAIKYLSLNRPDLILLDYDMPIADGKQAFEMIKSEAEFADIPIIFLTGKEDKVSVTKLVELKPEGYLLKTMGQSAIVKQVDEFFERQKALL